MTVWRSLLLICLTANFASAQYPQPHAAWKLVPGGENLVASSYWGSVFQWNDASAVWTAPAIGVLSVSNGVLSATAGTGYLGGLGPLGPWLYTSGDFGVVATIQTGSGLDGVITLTGSLPVGTQYWQGSTVISAGVSSAGDFILYYSDGTQAGPVFYKTLKPGSGTPTVGQVTVELLRQAGQFLVYFNGVPFGPFADPGLFKTGYVIPGFQAAPGQQLNVTQFALEVPESDSSAQLMEPVGVVPLTHTGDSLGSLAAVTGRDFNVVVDLEQIVLNENTAGSFTSNTPDPGLEPKVISEFGGLANNEMGPALTEPIQGHFLFDNGDALMATGKGTGRSTSTCGDLIDGTRIPYWVLNGNFTAAQLTQIIQTHIQTVVSHYGEQCTTWSVVNEAFNPDGTLAPLIWEQVIGPSYIDVAFQAARKAAPNAKLYLKDYGAENSNAKATGIYNFVTGMQQRGVPIDGVAMQAHWAVGSTSDCCVPDHDSIVANMAKLAGLGLLTRITELDVQVTLPASAADLATEAMYFGITVQACLDSSNCAGITVFAADDALSWINYTFPGKGAATMFDASFNPKPAYTSVMNTLRAAPKAATAITRVDTSWGGTSIAQNTFIEVKGVNLVPATTPSAGVIWSSAPDFASGKMPTNLSGVSVTVNGKPAFVYFYCSVVTSPVCSADQIDVLTPLDSTVGTVQVVVTSGTTVSPPFSVNMQAVVPTFLLFNALGPVVATHANYSLLGSGALYPGSTTPAQPGEPVIIYAIGFGLPVTTLTNGSATQSGALPVPPTCAVGGLPATVVANLISPGLYQLNLTIPAGAQSGDNAISCSYNGAATPAGDFITVQQ